MKVNWFVSCFFFISRVLPSDSANTAISVRCLSVKNWLKICMRKCVDYFSVLVVLLLTGGAP
jgi:hypothetical protein